MITLQATRPTSPLSLKTSSIKALHSLQPEPRFGMLLPCCILILTIFALTWTLASQLREDMIKAAMVAVGKYLKIDVNQKLKKDPSLPKDIAQELNSNTKLTAAAINALKAAAGTYIRTRQISQDTSNLIEQIFSEKLRKRIQAVYSAES